MAKKIKKGFSQQQKRELVIKDYLKGVKP